MKSNFCFCPVLLATGLLDQCQRKRLVLIRWSYLEAEAGLFLSLRNRRQLEEVSTYDQLDAPERLS